jgi:hypothetical protein
VSLFKRANAQVVLGMRGEAVNDKAYTEVVGNPYLINEWASGTVNLENNQSAPATLKFDICSNNLLFKGQNGEPLVLKNKINGFTLNNTLAEISNINFLVFVNGYPLTGKQTEATFYQLIADGPVRLLKYYKKNIDEHREFTSAVTTRTFKFFDSYYIFKKGQFMEFQPNKKSIVKLFDDHAAQLDAYIQANNINFKSDTDLQKLFNWYNSLI